MAIVCGCLNVSATGEESAEAEPPPTNLPDAPFFRRNLRCAKNGIVRCIEPALLEGRDLGEWTVYVCLLCRTETHASKNEAPRLMLLDADLHVDPDAVAARRNRPDLSPAFGLALPDREPAPGAPAHPAAAELNRRLNDSLRERLQAVEEEVRLFRDAKYLEYEQFRERARRDLGTILGALSTPGEAAPPAEPVARSEPAPVEPGARRPARGPGPKPTENSDRIGGHKEDSLDSEGIFDLEGMDSSDSPRNDPDSDVYDSDSDDSTSRDEGIHIMRNSNQQWRSNIAKSLPVNVPIFSQFSENMPDGHDRDVEDPSDIAASIKALARSVHGDVFGDLPRPRFSTQI